jgi:hypothetical protein
MSDRFAATLQFRTTLDQAGRIAGLAGELEVSESEVLRLLLDQVLDQKPAPLLASLRAAVRPVEPTEDEIDQAHAEGRVRSS